MKIAYVIASHTLPEQVKRLTRTLAGSSENAEVIIHHDPSKTSLDLGELRDHPRVHVVPDAIACEHSKHSVVKMMTHTFQWATNNLEYDWLVFMSGQDYPIRPFEVFEEELAAAQHDGFLNGASLEKRESCGEQECTIAGRPGKTCYDCIGLYYYQYYELPQSLSKPIGQPVQRWYDQIRRKRPQIRQRLIVRQVNEPPKQDTLIGFRRRKTPFNKQFHCYKGSQWFTVRRSCIEYALDYLHDHPEYEAYYRRTLVSNESYFHSILLNSQQFRFDFDNKRYITWQDRFAPRPKVLTSADFDQMIDSGKHFARKFDIRQDSDILDMLDDYIGANERAQALGRQ